MTRIIMLLAACISCLGVYSQKVKSQKYDIKYQQYNLINLPNEITNYSSVNSSLKFYSKEMGQNPSYQLRGKVFPMQTYTNVFGDVLETVSMSDISKQLASRPVMVNVTDKDDNIIYYRVFNDIYQEEPNDITSETSEMDKSGAFSDVSSQLSRLFINREIETKIKLFSVEKSTNHNDIAEANKHCLDGIASYNQRNYQEGKKSFTLAVEKWELALKQADVKDKKARINKKIADALYKNLVQILPFVERFDDANAMIEEHAKVIGGFSYLFTQGKAFQIKALKLNDKAKNNQGQFTFAELERDNEVTPLLKDDSKTSLGSSYDISKLIVGSWRFFYESFSLPTNAEAEKQDRNPDSECDENYLIHLLPNGEVKIQTGSWETGCEQEFDEFINFWAIKYTQDRGYFLVLADEKEDLEDPGMCTLFNVIDLNKNRLVIGGLTYPDGDTTRESVIQFQKISYILHDGFY